VAAVAEPSQPSSLASEASELLTAVRAGQRRALSRVLSAAESTRGEDRQLLDELWRQHGPLRPHGLRVAFTGPAGAGKSTLIERLGASVVQGGERLAVLPIDPSSQRSGGSLLADQTRMTELSRSERVFIRPSAPGGSATGLAPHAMESVELCELAGHPWIWVESVGVGQTQVEAESVVDVVLLLLTPEAGDELQALKRGLNESCDAVVINKAEADRAGAAAVLQRHYQTALSLTRTEPPPVFVLSAHTGDGVDALGAWLLARRAAIMADPQRLEAQRASRRVAQFDLALQRHLLPALLRDPARNASYTSLRERIARGESSVQRALLDFLSSLPE
jgi:LAO/AO transport system kinase